MIGFAICVFLLVEKEEHRRDSIRRRREIEKLSKVVSPFRVFFPTRIIKGFREIDIERSNERENERDIKKFFGS